MRVIGGVVTSCKLERIASCRRQKKSVNGVNQRYETIKQCETTTKNASEKIAIY